MVGRERAVEIRKKVFTGKKVIITYCILNTCTAPRGQSRASATSRGNSNLQRQDRRYTKLTGPHPEVHTSKPLSPRSPPRVRARRSGQSALKMEVNCRLKKCFFLECLKWPALRRWASPRLFFCGTPGPGPARTLHFVPRYAFAAARHGGGGVWWARAPLLGCDEKTLTLLSTRTPALLAQADA